MIDDSIDRRKQRRVGLAAPTAILTHPGGNGERVQEGTTRDVSLAGAYVTIEEAKAAEATQQGTITISITIPRSQAREFPFSRLVGPARIVRVDPLGAGDKAQKLVGLAIEFAEDFTALTATPDRP